jgi:hypothetical protein
VEDVDKVPPLLVMRAAAGGATAASRTVASRTPAQMLRRVKLIVAVGLQRRGGVQHYGMYRTP